MLPRLVPMVITSDMTLIISWSKINMLGFVLVMFIRSECIGSRNRCSGSKRDREKGGDRLQTIKSRSGRSSGLVFVDGRHLRAGSDVRWRGSQRCGGLGGDVCVGVALSASVVLPVAGSAPSQDWV